MNRFSFDTSAFIEGVRHYPFDVAESLWKRIDDRGKRQIVTAQEDVRLEIEAKHDALAKWLKTRPHFFQQPSETVQTHVRLILRDHPRLVAVTRNRSGADAWVIAHAMAMGGAVVTYESWDQKRKNVKIPDVCDALGVECLTFVDFLRRCEIKLTVA